MFQWVIFFYINTLNHWLRLYLTGICSFVYIDVFPDYFYIHIGLQPCNISLESEINWIELWMGPYVINEPVTVTSTRWYVKEHSIGCDGGRHNAMMEEELVVDEINWIKVRKIQFVCKWIYCSKVKAEMSYWKCTVSLGWMCPDSIWNFDRAVYDKGMLKYGILFIR
jgi:hypothetical protein